MIRNAKLPDYWRAINSGNSSCYINRVYYQVDGHPPNQIELEKGITAFIGRNGSRKTTLIRGIYRRLPSSKRNRNILEDRTSTLKIIDGEFQSHTTSVCNLSNATTPIEAFLFDPCSSVPELRGILRRDENMDDLFEIGELKQLNGEELKTLEYLTGNSYASASYVVVEDYNDEYPRFPIFKVERDGMTYDSRDMGYGELSILLFYWILEQVKGCQEDKEDVVVFLEEPESFISPEYQKRLMAFCARVVVECKCQALVVSHSEHIISRIKHSNIFNIRWSLGGVEIGKLTRTSEVLQELGLVASRSGFLACEDVHSKALIKELLRTSPRFGVGEFVIQSYKGEGEVRNCLSNIPGQADGFRFIGVLDGDCRSQNWGDFRTCFLPGEVPPEILLINWFKGLLLSDQASLLRRSEAETSRLLDSCKGIDHHDYFLKASEGDRSVEESIFSSVCSAWVIGNPKEVLAFLRDFENAFDRT